MPPGSFDPADHIFITHGHIDHLRDTPDLLSRLGGYVYCTETPAITLRSRGVRNQQIRIIAPGHAVNFEKSGIRVRVKRGKHILFDPPKVIGTLASPRMMRYRENLKILREALQWPESDETVIFEVDVNGRLVTIIGSLAIDRRESYTAAPDLLILPYQGHTRMAHTAYRVAERIKPGAIMLDHFDDAFPPLSRDIDTSPFTERMREQMPGVTVIQPIAGRVYSFSEQ
jgi:L-ascorbate metabolism protein UlaG (beta-lactamase superfamily)